MEINALGYTLQPVPWIPAPGAFWGFPPNMAILSLPGDSRSPGYWPDTEPAQMVASSGMWLEILRVMGPFLHSAQALRNSQSDTICL